MSRTTVEISRCVCLHFETRMHSSTMRTARFSGHLYREGSLPLGRGGVCLWVVVGVCLWVQGVSAWVQGGFYHTPFTTPPPFTRMPPQQTATAADGTHPIGMHSCFTSMITASLSSLKANQP